MDKRSEVVSTRLEANENKELVKEFGTAAKAVRFLVKWYLKKGRKIAKKDADAYKKWAN